MLDGVKMICSALKESCKHWKQYRQAAAKAKENLKKREARHSERAPEVRKRCCVVYCTLGQDALAKKKAGRKRKGKGNADGDNEAADAADPPAVLLDGMTKSDPAVLQAFWVRQSTKGGSTSCPLWIRA